MINLIKLAQVAKQLVQIGVRDRIKEIFKFLLFFEKSVKNE